MTRHALDAADCALLVGALDMVLRHDIDPRTRARAEQLRALFDLLSCVEPAGSCTLCGGSTADRFTSICDPCGDARRAAREARQCSSA